MSTWADTTWLVYRDGNGVSHTPGANPGTPYTACGVDAGDMKRIEHPITAAALWCTDCFRALNEPAALEGDTPR